MRYEATLLVGDNVRTMRQFQADSIALTVTSPPYDALRTYEGFEWNFEEVAHELFRITKNGGVCVWIVGDATVGGSETGSSFKQALYFMQCGFNLHDTMIWLKPHFANPSNNRCHQVFEYMFVFSKGKPATFNQLRDVPVKYGKPVGKSSLRKVDGSIENGVASGSTEAFGGRSNVWKINTVGQEQFGKKQAHPAAFSEQLALDHILSWSNVGDLVFDPFLGSGTTGVSAMRAGRYFVGCDISDKYVREIAEPRIDAALWCDTIDTTVNIPHNAP